MTIRKHPLAECEVCPLQTKKCAPTAGPKDAKIALVSRSPGYHDAKAGRPFSGPSGDVLNYLLGKYGVKRADILTTNVVLCETDDPPKDALTACRPRLLDEIKNVDLIIAGGAEAVSVFTDKRSVTAARGFAHSYANKRVIATNNPALVLRKSDAFPDLVADFRLALDPIPPPKFPTVEIINDAVKARAVLRAWTEGDSLNNSVIASDLEWRNNVEFVCAGFSRDGSKSVVFGLKAIEDRINRDLLKRFYESSSISFVWHNGKSDTKVLRHNGIHARVDEDTFLLSYALDEEPGRHSLEHCLMTDFGWPDYEPESVKHFKKTGLFDYYGTTPELMSVAETELYEYNGWDAAGTKQLYDLFAQRAKDDNVYDAPYKSILLPASEAFLQVEMRGFHYDTKEAHNLREREVIPYLERLRKSAQEITGHGLLNLGSTKQVGAIYYDEYGLVHTLKDSGKKKFARSTGDEVRTEILEGRVKCKPQYREKLVRLASVQEEFNEIDKQRGTYIEGLIKKVADDGKLYCRFNIGGTVTGRTSSQEPNFQNITRQGRRGIPGIRTLFRPSDGCSIIQADFSQAELRTCAVLSGDKNLLAIYSDSNRSLHRERAAAFYGSDYTKEQYVKSKNINFGVTYGQSAAAFAQMYHMDGEEAQAYIDSWWNEFPQLHKWVQGVWREAQTEGRVISPFGHKRRFHLITRENINNVTREAVNFLPQNIAGNLTIAALCDLVDDGVPVISTVHDSILADVPNEQVGNTAQQMKEVMEAQAMKRLGWTLPFTVDVSVSDVSWADVHEVTIEELIAA